MVIPVSGHAAEGSQQLTEYQVKAAFVFNVARYVVWQKSHLPASETVNIGILGRAPFSGDWDNLKGKTLQGRQVTVRTSTDMDDLRNCQVVFIEKSERRNVVRHLLVLRSDPVLTISDIDDFHHNGGMVCLRVVNNRMTMSFNLKNVRAAGLDVSSYLLRLAIEVLK